MSLKSSKSDFAFDLNRSSSMEQQELDRILACNQASSEYGLSLSLQQAEALVQTGKLALEKTGRIEFGSGVIDKIISAFCTSIYISSRNYEETLHELITLFYDFKNETCDAVSDIQLISFMKNHFDGCCHGSLELLASQALTQLSLHIRSGKSYETFEYKAE